MCSATLISSRDNPKIKNVVQLSLSASRRQKSGLFVIDGLRLCCDAVINGFTVREAYFTERFMKEHPDEYRSIASSSESSFEVTDDIMKKMSDTVSPQGCLCVCSIPEFSDDSYAFDGKYVVLENIADPGNLGTISRTAEAMGITAVISCGGCDIYSPKALRASMGALLRLKVVRTAVDDAVSAMKNCGIKLYAAVVCEYDCTINNCDFSGGSACFIGNEANGLTASTVQQCDVRMTIPMNGRAESLNAASAASIIIWEMMK